MTDDERIDELAEIAELERQVAELKAELRNYEPSDGVMHQQLAFTEAIREAAQLFERAAKDNYRKPPEDHVSLDTWEKIDDWLELPVVKACRR